MMLKILNDFKAFFYALMILLMRVRFWGILTNAER